MSSNEGIKITKPGHDIRTAGDIDLIFSSSWPNVTIAAEIDTTLSSVAHGLDFPPFTIGWNTSGGLTQTVFPNVSSTLITTNTSFPNPLTYGTINYKCFNIDLSQDASYPFILPSASPNVYNSPNFGIKLTKDGKNVNSSDLRDYILHSRCQSPQILTVKTASDPAGGTLSVPSGLGYTSWVFGYVKHSGSYGYAPYHAQAYPVTVINNVTNTYSITYVAGDSATLVILRDPMFSATKISASY